MSKPIREVGQDKRADFNNAVSEILYAKSEIEKWQKYNMHRNIKKYNNGNSNILLHAISL